MRWKPSIAFVSIAFFVLILAEDLGSQIRARIDLVVVPVSVRDNNGFLVTGLERSDFTVLEDGKPQKIINFSIDPQPLSAAVVIDDGISAHALKQLVPLLPSMASAFAPVDEMTSFRYDHLVTRLMDFTQNPKEIEKSFADLDRIADSRPEEPERPEVYDKIEKKTPSIVRAIAGLFSIGSNGAPPTIPTAPAPRPAPASRTLHSAIYEAAITLQERPDGYRRIILLVSDGVVSEPRNSVVPGKTLHSFSKNLEVLLPKEIQVYSVDTRASLLEELSGELSDYAHATGGAVYGGKTDSDMKFAFDRIVEQARTEYVLGYVSDNVAPPQGIYRKIEVRSGDKDLKRTVTHRRGYMQYPIPK